MDSRRRTREACQGSWHCNRCQGLLVADDLIDMEESSVPMRASGWRCVSCGNVVDPVIQRHRMIQASGVLREYRIKSARPAALKHAKIYA